LTLADPEIDRHLPWIRSVRSCTTVHCCEAPPLHVPMFTAVPSAVPFPASFRHLPPTSKRTGPVGPWPGAAATVHPYATEPEVPAASDALT
jgi:hypothetical protein